jgi:predicted PurR-regulated permease PerM
LGDIVNDKEFRTLMRIFGIAVFLAIIYMTFPYLDTLALSCAFAYMAKPLFDKIKVYVGSSAAALICLLVFIVPIVIVGFIILKELFLLVQQLNIQNMDLQSMNILGMINSILNDFLGIFGYSYYIDKETLLMISYQTWEYISPYMQDTIVQLTMIPELVIKLMVILFMTYYFLRDGHYTKNIILSHVPDEYYGKTELFLRKLNESYTNLFIGNVLTSMAIGVISGIGYYIIGVPNAFILAVITGIFALLPIIGGWTVYIPISIYYIITGEILKGIELLLFGAIFLSTMPDFVIRPTIVKKESDVHPALILIAFLIGPLTLGLAGFAVGPLIVGAFDAMWKLKLCEK